MPVDSKVSCATMEATNLARRQSERYRLSHAMKIVPLAVLPGFSEGPRALPAEVIDISRGGVCVRTAAPLPISRPVRGEVSVREDIAVGLPVLMQVRWHQKCDSKENQYLNGLQFLI